MSLFISFEGGEGTGKSTQARLLHERLNAEGRKALLVHEPGGTELGSYLRTWLKAAHKPLTPESELFLFVAARSELVRRVVRPALGQGTIVIADRYADSTIAYQGYGRLIPLDTIASANDLATDGLWPQLTILLDIDPGQGLYRARNQSSFDDQARMDTTGRADEADQRRFEAASEAFHRRVRSGFLKLATETPKRWLVLEAGQPVEALADQVGKRVATLLQQVAPK